MYSVVFIPVANRSSHMAKAFEVGCYMQTFQPNSLIFVQVISTTDLNHFIPLSWSCP